MPVTKTYNDASLTYDDIATSYEGVGAQEVFFKIFIAGDEFTAAEIDQFLMNQMVMTFANSSERDSALTGNLEKGMVAYLSGPREIAVYDEISWQRLAFDADISNADVSSIQKRIYMR